MRGWRMAMAAITCVGLACSKDAPTSPGGTLPPGAPAPIVQAYAHVVLFNGAPELQVDVTVLNATKQHFHLAMGDACPVTVRIFPDATGEQQRSVNGGMACSGPTGWDDVAPGDYRLHVHVVDGDSLAKAATPGLYGVNAIVTTKEGLISVWADSVRLPLVSPQ